MSKLSDNEIKKALECCSSSTGAEACRGCPFNEKDICDNEDEAPQKYALDLINRLEAEIERLNKEIDRLSQCVMYHDGQIVDAIKGFAEKLEAALDERVSKKIRERNPHWYLAKRIVRETAIEMTEVQE